MAVAKDPLLGGVLVSTGLALGVGVYVLVSAVLLRAAGEALLSDSIAALGSVLVLLSGVLLWLGVVVLPVRI